MSRLLRRFPETVKNQPFKLNLSSRVYNKLAKAVARSELQPSDRRYNITVSHSHKFIWFRVAKTGTRSLLDTLQSQSVNLAAEHPMSVHYPAAAYADYFKFAIVRNPWDRLVSTWNNKVVDQNWWNLTKERRNHLLNFSNFITYAESLNINNCDVHLRSQASVIDLNHIDYIGRFENLEFEVQKILQNVGLHIPALAKRNVSKSQLSYIDMYTDDEIQRVLEIYRKDVQLFGYSFL